MIKIGEKLGNFLIRSEIGCGGMGTIYSALDTMLNREVALKVVHPQLAGNRELMERFKIEAMTQARLNHPHIVTIFSFNRIEDETVIAMEYVEGRSLKDLLLEKKHLRVDEAVDIISQVAEGLRYAHARNVIHRDIKPANILIGRDGMAKISDFGIAKILGTQSLTKTGMMVGTPWYTSPEQIVGKSVDCRSDLYSLGVTFYEVLTGRVPFDSESNSEFQIQKAHLETPPPRPSIYNPEIGAKLEKFILSALQKNVEKRFQSAGDMIHELQRIRFDLTKAGLAPLPGVTQRIADPARERRRFLLAPLKVFALLCLLLAGIALIVVLSGKSGMDEEAGGGSGPAAVRVSEDKGPQDAESSAPAAARSVAGSTDAAVIPDAGALPAAQPGDAQKNAAPAEEPAEQRPAPGQGTTPAVPLASLEKEMSRLHGFLAARNFPAADRLSEALIRSGAEPRAFPLLGKAKFLLNQFAAAEKLWAQALEANLMISLEIAHWHGGAGDFCQGQLKFKKKFILFSSNTQGDHSFALASGLIRPVALGSRLAIHLSGVVDGQEISEDFQLPGRVRRLDKAKFLVGFLNQYVL